MACCQKCNTELTNETAYPSVVERGRGECRECAGRRTDAGRAKNPKSWLLYSSRARCKRNGLENTLTLADIPDLPKRCPVFPWIVIEHEVGNGRRAGSPSLDRIDNNVGYVSGNIRVISWRANFLKHDATDKELAALGADATKRNT